MSNTLSSARIGIQAVFDSRRSLTRRPLRSTTKCRKLRGLYGVRSGTPREVISLTPSTSTSATFPPSTLRTGFRIWKLHTYTCPAAVLRVLLRLTARLFASGHFSKSTRHANILLENSHKTIHPIKWSSAFDGICYRECLTLGQINCVYSFYFDQSNRDEKILLPTPCYSPLRTQIRICESIIILFGTVWSLILTHLDATYSWTRESILQKWVPLCKCA